MSLQGSIRPIPRHRVENRQDQRLPEAWIQTSGTSSAPSELRWFSQSKPASFRTEKDAPVLVMLQGHLDDAVHHELLTHARAGSRVYVLAPAGWGAQGVEPELLYASRVLIRRVKEVPASAIHTVHGSRVWLGGTWHLRLDDAQSELLRHVFLRQFWHDALEEAWTGGKSLLWRVAAQRPFDVPDVSLQASIQMARDLRIDEKIRGAWVHWSGQVPPDEPPRQLWIRPESEHHERLADFVRKQAVVCWEDRGLPDMVVHRDRGQVLIKSGQTGLRIALNAEQATDASQILQTTAQWSFGVDVRIGEAALRSAKFWLRGEKNARGLEEEQRISLPDVPATSLRMMSTTQPAKFEPAQPLALAARYAWTVVPPKLPPGSAEAPLHEQWYKIDAEWIDRLNKLDEALRDADEKRGSLRKAFVGLVGAMLGFGNKHDELLEQVTKLKQKKPSVCGPDKAREWWSDLTSIENRARGLQTDLEKAESDEKRRLDEEKQKQEWKARVEDAHAELPVKHEERAAEEKRRENFEAELHTVKEERKVASEEAKKDLHVKEMRLNDDIKQCKKKLSALNDEIRTLEEEVKKDFRYRPAAENTIRPKQQTSGRFAPPAASGCAAVDIPEHALPEVGNLRVVKNQRYLVIQTWEELDAGEKAAERLEARLVAPEKS